MPDSLTKLVFHESKARLSESFEPDLIPGLLQTEEHARALESGRTDSVELVEARTSRRIDRQRILFGNKGARFDFLIHERALRMEVGSSQTMHDQMIALLVASRQQNSRIRVVPEACGYQGLVGGAFRLLRFTNFPPLVHQHIPIGGVFIEKPQYVKDYASVVRGLAERALDPVASQEFIARLADEYAHKVTKE